MTDWAFGMMMSDFEVLTGVSPSSLFSDHSILEYSDMLYSDHSILEYSDMLYSDHSI